MRNLMKWGVAAVAAFGFAASAQAADPVKIGAFLSVTGPA
ncbi:MAG: hypothetical protein FD119_2205, partial [Stygiobacter sp.]